MMQQLCTGSILMMNPSEWQLLRDIPTVVPEYKVQIQYTNTEIRPGLDMFKCLGFFIMLSI